jgi:hypothetical protein
MKNGWRLQFRIEYPLWQYPFIFMMLAYHFRIYCFGWRKRVATTMAWRKEIGIFSENYIPTFKNGCSFGHWLVSQWLLDKWY